MASILSYFWNSRRPDESGASHTTPITAEDEDWVVVDDSESISVIPSFSPTLSNLADDDSALVSEPPMEPILKEISDLPPQDLSPPPQVCENIQLPQEATSNGELHQTTSAAIESLPELDYFVTELPSMREYHHFVYCQNVIESDSDSDDEIEVDRTWMISSELEAWSAESPEIMAEMIVREKNIARAGQVIASKQSFNSIIRKTYRKSIQKNSRVFNYSKPPLAVGKNKSKPLTYQRGSKGSSKEAKRRS